MSLRPVAASDPRKTDRIPNGPSHENGAGANSRAVISPSHIHYTARIPPNQVQISRAIIIPDLSLRPVAASDAREADRFLLVTFLSLKKSNYSLSRRTVSVSE